MYLQSLKLEDVRDIEQLEIDFTSGIDSQIQGKNGLQITKTRPITVVIGENGTCKTTILESIAMLCARYDRSKSMGFTKTMEATTTLAGLNRTATNFFKYLELLEQEKAKEEKKAYTRKPRMHIVFAYGTTRFIQRQDKTSEKYEEMMMFRNLFERAEIPYCINLFDTVPSDKRRAFRNDPVRFGAYTTGINTLLSTFLSTLTEQEVSVTVDREEVYVKINDQPEKMAQNLPSGYQSLLCILIDLVNHFVILNQLNWVDPQEMQGIVLIDEIDLHLHATWQRKILDLLHGTFPDIQWIVTTHSPILLMGRKKAEIVKLEFVKTGDDQNDQKLRVRRKEDLESPARMSGSEIIEEYFGIPAQKQLQTMLNRYAYLYSFAQSDAEKREKSELRQILLEIDAQDEIEKIEK